MVIITVGVSVIEIIMTLISISGGVFVNPFRYLNGGEVSVCCGCHYI